MSEILVTANGNYQTPPPEGTYPATLTEIRDIGEVTGPYGTKPCLRLGLELEEVNPETGEFYKLDGLFNRTLAEKSKLRAATEAALGRRLTADEVRAGFDVMKIVGARVLAQVTHVQKNDLTFGRIAAVLPAPRHAARASAPPKAPAAPSRKPEMAKPKKGKR